MKRIVDQERLKVVWGLDRWYEKSMYVLGVVYTIIFAIAFTVGFVVGFMEGQHESYPNTSSCCDINRYNVKIPNAQNLSRN